MKRFVYTLLFCAAAVSVLSAAGAMNAGTEFDLSGLVEMLLSLGLTVAVYSLSILIYRYGIRRRPMEPKKAKRTVTLYGIVSFVVMAVILDALTGETPTGTPILLWGWVNYGMLTDGYDEEAEFAPFAPAPAPQKKTSSLSKGATLAWIYGILLVISLGLNIWQYQETEQLIQQAAETQTQVGNLEAYVSSLESVNGLLRKELNEYHRMERSLRGKNIGAASNQFQVDKSLVVVSVGDFGQQVKLTTSFGQHISVNIEHSTDAAELSFDQETWYGSTTTLTVHPNHTGATVVTFSNDKNDQTFRMLILVVD